MFKTILLTLFVISLSVSQIALAKKDKGNKGPSDKAYESANENASFKREKDKEEASTLPYNEDEDSAKKGKKSKKKK